MRADTPVLLAIGMNAAPFNFAKRRLVRETMLQSAPVVSGRVVFRFVIGNVLIAASRPLRRKRWDTDREALRAELAQHDDMVELDAIDGPGVAMECPAAEKTIAWMRHAIASWPEALFFGKTEDDTYVQFDALAAELSRLHAMDLPNVMYGLMGICSMPTADRAERASTVNPRRPAHGRLGSVATSAPAATGYKACFLGSFERIGWVTGGYRSIMQWRSSQVGPSHGKCVRGSSTPAPFPTGPLAVLSSSLARAVYSRCAYLEDFAARGRAANRQTLCRGVQRARSWASLVGDCAIGHWVSMCARGLNVSIAHMTYTKNHHYALHAGGQGWVAPSNDSIVVHYLKKHTGASGPNGTEGGEWRHAHRAASASGANAGFPPLLWTYLPHRVLRSGRLIGDALNPSVHQWYAVACGVMRESIGDHVQRLVERTRQSSSSLLRLDRARGSAEHGAEAGDPSSWPFYGCHPSRGYAHPVWAGG